MKNGACPKHGGKSLKGLASPRFRDGSRSRYLPHLPSRLGALYTEARNDVDPLSLSEDISLLDARIADLLQRVDSGESGDLWKSAKGAFDNFAKAQAAKDKEGSVLALTELGDLLRRGVSDHAAWREIFSTMKQRVKLVESERKRAIEQQEMVSVRQVLSLLGEVATLVKANVTDRAALMNISAGLAKYTGVTNH